MSPAAEQLCARIVAAPKQGPGRRRYSTDLKRAVVEHAFVREGERATIREIAEELGLSATLLGRWLRHARRRLKNGKIPFEPGEPPTMRDLQGMSTEPTAAGSTSSQAEPVEAGSVSFSVPPSGCQPPSRLG